MKKVSVVIVITFLVTVLTTGLAWGKEPAAPEITLNQAIEMAGQYSKTLKKANLEVDRTAELRTYRYDQLDYVPYGIPNNPAIEVAWSSMLSADLNWQMSKKSLGMEEDRLILDVCQKYWNVVVALDKVEAKKLALQQAELDMRKAGANSRVGLITPLNLTQAEAGLAAAKASLGTAENELDEAYVNLNKLLGLWPQDQPVLLDSLELIPIHVDNLDTAVQRVIEASPSIWLAQERATMQKYLENLMFYTGDYRPYQARKIEVTQAELDAASAKETMRVLTRTLYYNVLNLEETYSTLEEMVKIAEESLRVTTLKYDLGMVTRADVAAAESALAEAKQNALSVLSNQAYYKLAFQKPWAMSMGGS